MSHRFKQSEMRRFYRSMNDVFTGFETSEETEAGYALTYPATGRWGETLAGFQRDFIERFPAFRVSVDRLSDGRLRVRLCSGQESRKFLEGMIAAAQSESLVLPSRLVSTYRRATGVLRMRPSFLVIGAPRCGTTSLYSYVCQHPRVRGAVRKELGFFDIFYGRGFSYYRSMFPLAGRKVDDGGRWAAVTGEATPTYLAHPLVPRRVRAALPKVKLVAVVRNPIDRAISHYHWGVGNGVEDLSFEEAIDREEERLAGEFERITADVDHFSAGWAYHSYLSTGRYAEHLERWAASFPREQLLVVGLEAFAADPLGEFRRVLEFLELPPFEPEQFGKINAVEYATVNPKMRRRLEEHFRPHNERLWDFLGADLGWNQPGWVTGSAVSP